MKKCTICKLEKPNEDFYKNPGTKDRMGSQCKNCDKTERVRMYKEKKQFLVNILGGKCKNCGYNKSLSALDFHHRDGQDKKFNISYKLKHSLEKLMIEIQKCDILCANCHRELHENKI